MKLTIKDLQEYAKMNATERKTDRGREIREELNMRLRWMPIKWRKLIYWRYIKNSTVIKTAMQIHVTDRTVIKWTNEIARWLEDKDKYLEELV